VEPLRREGARPLLATAGEKGQNNKLTQPTVRQERRAPRARNLGRAGHGISHGESRPTWVRRTRPDRNLAGTKDEAA